MSCLTRCIHHEIDSFKALFLNLIQVNCINWKWEKSGIIKRKLQHEFNILWGRGLLEWETHQKQIAICEAVIERFNMIKLFCYFYAKMYSILSSVISPLPVQLQSITKAIKQQIEHLPTINTKNKSELWFFYSLKVALYNSFFLGTSS